MKLNEPLILTRIVPAPTYEARQLTVVYIDSLGGPQAYVRLIELDTPQVIIDIIVEDAISHFHRIETQIEQQTGKEA